MGLSPSAEAVNPQYPVPKKIHMPHIIYEALVICPVSKSGRRFGKTGLAHADIELKEAVVVFRETQNVEEMSKYADVVTHAFCDWCANDPDGQIDPTKPIEFEINEITVANCAYISLHAASLSVREHWSKVVAALLKAPS